MINNSGTTCYVTTSIPYVNAAPHLGHALELVQADVIARHRRLRERPTRFLTGTDEFAAKNVSAAHRANIPIADFVAAHAQRFIDLAAQLEVSNDDFIRTSADPRHGPAVDKIWRRTAARGDYYRRDYTGLYCLGCEQFYVDTELLDGRCPEHGVEPERVTESNWFFALSRYAQRILDVIESGRLRIEPAERRNEVLAFVRGGLSDISVSRPRERADGWGVPVPDDPSQVVYVWWDALTNYIAALGYGTDEADYRRWWIEAGERIHVVGKGITRFHAVYWVALLLAAEEPLPTTILVHDYLTANGAKLSKTTGNTIDPSDILHTYGQDAVRWWLSADVARVGDTDFTIGRLRQRYQQDLAGGIGNLVNRTVSLVHRYRDGHVPAATSVHDHDQLLLAIDALPASLDRALDRFDLRTATDQILEIVTAGNREIERWKPWDLARRSDHNAQSRLDGLLACLVLTCRTIGHELGPFLPDGSTRLLTQLGNGGPALPTARPAFPRLPTSGPDQGPRS